MWRRTSGSETWAALKLAVQAMLAKVSSRGAMPLCDNGNMRSSRGGYRGVRNAIGSACVFIVALLAISTFTTSSAHAAPPNVWWTSDGTPDGGYYPSRYAGCQANYDYGYPGEGWTYKGMESDGNYAMCYYQPTPANGVTHFGFAYLNCQQGQKRDQPPYCCDETMQTCEPPEPTPQCPAPGVGNPINLVTGVKTQYENDFSTADGKLYLERVYTNDPGDVQDIGWGWTSSLSRSLVIELGQARVTLGDGRVARFAQITSSVWRPMYPSGTPGTWDGGWYADSTNYRKDVAWKFTKVGSNYKFTDEDGHIENFNSSYQLTSINWLGGYNWTYTYNGSGQVTTITDTFGRTVQFTYGSNENIDTVTAPDGQVYHFTYNAGEGGSASLPDPTSTLATIIYPDATSSTLTDNPRRTYHYEVSDFPLLLTGVTDERSVRARTWNYDAGARGILSEKAGGVEQFNLSFSNSSFATTVTNPLGRTATYDSTVGAFSVGRLNSVSEAASTYAASASRSYAYNSNSFLSQITDAEGRVTKFVRNTRGLETSRTEGFGTAQARTITTSWDATYAVPTQIVEPGLTTDITVDSAGKITKIKKTDTTSTSTPYSTNGQIRATDYAYTTSGLLDTVDGPLSGTGDLTNYDYTTDGYLSQVTDAVGHITSITSLDGAGRPLTVLDENGVITAITYTPRGWVESITVKPGASQRVTAFEYNAAGGVTKITRPGTGTLTYTYDNAERLTKVENNFAETINFTYNNASLVTARTVKNSSSTTTQTQTMVYDEIGRLLQKIGASSETETRGYDKEHNLTAVTDPRSKLYSKAYDPLNRLITETNPDSQTNQYTYNGKSELLTQRDGRALQTTYVRNGFGDVIRETSPDRGVTDYWYDARARVTKIVDAASVEINFTYDNIDRPLTKTFPGSTALNQAFTYDSTASSNKGVGRLTSLSDGYGSASYVYDDFGDLITESRTTGSHTYQTAYLYDKDGAVTQITYPSGRQVRYVRDTQSRITAVDTRATSGGSWVAVASSVTWKPFGPLAGLTFGNGLNLTLGYNQNYWLTAIDTAQGGTTTLDLDIGRNADGRVASITDNVASSRTEAYTYTNSARLASGSGAWGSKAWTYDTAGNRTAETKVVSGVTTNDVYNYGSTSNRLNSIYTDPSGTTLKRSFSYRANGQTSQDVRVGDGTYDYIYKSDGRLSEVKKASATLAVYGYDADGRRVTRAVTSGITRDYVYGASGRLLAEANASGATLRDYLWLEDLPLAVVDGGTTYYVHAGQRGEPLAMTNSSKTKVWDAVVEPFGAAQVFTSTVAMDRRLPGQDLQAETALSQNGQRDYDPAIGRYIEPDPIGLDGGPHVYGYVGQDPLTYVDPNGLDIIVGYFPGPTGHIGLGVNNPRTTGFYPGGARPDRSPDGGKFVIPTTPQQDFAVQAYIDAHRDDKYDLFKNNCIDFVRGALSAAGLSNLPPRRLLPIDNYNALEKAYGRGTPVDPFRNRATPGGLPYSMMR